MSFEMRTVVIAALAAAAAACAAPMQSLPSREAPAVDYHQHLVSPAWAPIVERPARDAGKLLAEMDSAGVEKAVVLSAGYSFADERKKLPGPDLLTRTENDWTSAQAAASGGRLIGFCSANPLRSAALAELTRCLSLPAMIGIKIHVGNSGLSFRDPAHVARLAAIFALSQSRGSPILIHMRPRGGAAYGSEDVDTFLQQVVAHAPSVPVIVAHLGASSPGYPVQNDDVMGAFAVAAQRGEPLMRNVYFDVAANVGSDLDAADAERIALRMRQIGVGKFLYGSDLTPPGGSIAEGWRQFRTTIPLTETELQTIAGQRLPFVD